MLTTAIVARSFWCVFFSLTGLEFPRFQLDDRIAFIQQVRSPRPSVDVSCLVSLGRRSRFGRGKKSNLQTQKIALQMHEEFKLKADKEKDFESIVAIVLLCMYSSRSSLRLAIWPALWE